MPRYIDADALESELFRDGIAGLFLDYPRRRRYTIGDIRGMLKNERIAPTADVVPRAEVEEIFSELYKEIESALNSNYKARRERINGRGARDMFLNVVDGKIAALRGLHEFVEYLEEKHTGGE